MNRCLDDQTLWLLSEGEASRGDHAHVAACAHCTTRLRRLQGDVQQLTAVLREPPPRQPARPLPWAARAAWWPATAALAAVLMLAWLGLWSRSSMTLPLESSQESVWSFIEVATAALFTPVDDSGIGASGPLADLEDLQAALVGVWPCDEPILLVDMGCTDDHAFALFLGGQ